MRCSQTLLTAALFLFSGLAQAHKASDSYLRLAVDGATVSGQWDVALRDLNALVKLDGDGDGHITWGELKLARGAVETELARALKLKTSNRACPVSFTQLRVDTHSDGAYAVLDVQARCPAAVAVLSVSYHLLFDQDPSHRGLLKLEFGGARSAAHSAAFAPDRRVQYFTSASAGILETLWQHVHEGAWHVWTGLDHVLFLACLLLPAVVRRQGRNWIVSESAARSFKEILIVITAFTLAHAATLTLVLLENIELSSRWVESLVAATVAFAALNNLYPLVRRRLWLLSFGFGLIHGAAIASVLAALDLARSNLFLALLGFNLGVEGGQLVVVAVWLPLAYHLRRQRWYQWAVVGGGSIAALVIALIWLMERATAL